MTIVSRFLSRFRRDRRGNVVMLFGISVFALVGAAGGAVDLSRIASAKRAMQDAADIAVLRTMNMNGVNDGQRQGAADIAFAQNFDYPDVSNISKTYARTVNGRVISADYVVKATVASYFGAFFGKDSYDVTVDSKAQTAMDTYEIAMVLDTTLSMAELNKMPNLKSSVDTALASLLTNGVNTSNSKVAIVPFNTNVRLSSATVTSMWNNGLIQGGVGSCVADRDKSYDFDVKADPATTSNIASKYLLTPCSSGAIKEAQGLSTNINAARSFIQTLQPGGTTNITIGIQWGMEALSPNAPFTGAVAFHDPSVQKVMIVVTDGDNTANRWGSIFDGTITQAQIDARTAKACTNAKALGITVFTVRVIEGNSAMLRACASDPDKFYDLKTASQLNTAMAGIFKSITKTRLTQ